MKVRNGIRKKLAGGDKKSEKCRKYRFTLTVRCGRIANVVQTCASVTDPYLIAVHGDNLMIKGQARRRIL